MNEETGKVASWALSRPVLTQRLRIIAFDAQDSPHGNQELSCTVTDLLDPARGTLWTEYLQATGAATEAADKVWSDLGGIAGIHQVDWAVIRERLLSEKPLLDE